MLVAVYGGSFNPVHLGHALAAQYVLWTGQAEQVWWLPTFKHPFDKGLAEFSVRMAWCQRVAEGLPGVEVCAIEQELSVPSYSIDTLDELTVRYPQHQFRWVMGADVLGDFHKWKEHKRLLSQYSPVVIGRQGYRCEQATIEMPGVSSTAIRAAAERDLPIGHLVHHVIRDEVRAFYGERK